jgi:hypothetical protein
MIAVVFCDFRASLDLFLLRWFYFGKLDVRMQGMKEVDKQKEPKMSIYIETLTRLEYTSIKTIPPTFHHVLPPGELRQRAYVEPPPFFKIILFSYLFIQQQKSMPKTCRKGGRQGCQPAG